jgi:DNA modification methylase
VSAVPRQGRPAPGLGRSDGSARRVSRVAHDLVVGECVEEMACISASRVDAVVCDPPYGIGWKNQRWDSQAIHERAGRNGRLPKGKAFEVWCEAWGGESLRVMKPGAHLLAFGSPRTYHRLVSGLENSGLEIRDSLMWLYGTGMAKSRRYPGGRSSALKPAFEPIVLARRPPEGTIGEALALHGTGALEAAACRVNGRHPANVIPSHEQECREESCAPGCAAALLDFEAPGGSASKQRVGPSRFLYCPKPSRAERDAGCEGLPAEALDFFPDAAGPRPDTVTRNPHSTLKPIELMRWLVRLVSPSDGLVLDPFMGSGTTGIAAALEGRRFYGIESDARYVDIARARIAHWSRESAASG